MYGMSENVASVPCDTTVDEQLGVGDPANF